MSSITAARRRITMERRFEATLEEVWELWTTREGIESWWGPEGFSVTVKHLELREGGHLDYDMVATDEGTIAFMKANGMPVVTPAHITFTEVIPPRRLAYLHLADFIPGVESYDVATVVDIEDEGAGVVVLRLTFDAMHDDEWTARASAGWTSELGKLEHILKARRPSP